jgi:fructokinase
MAAKSILALGEVLWDVFPDGAKFGGAPANFACGCAGLGGPLARVALASAVGGDDLGQRAVERLAERGVDTALVATRDRPTGQVLVCLDAAGRPSYQFIPDPAWDHVPWGESLRTAASEADVVCFGTLGQWADESRRTIRAAVAAARPDALRILDINLRPPYWTPEVVVESLALANVLKLNDEELPILAGLLNVGGEPENVLRAVMARHGLRYAALTRGPNGAVLLAADGRRSETPGVSVAVADTVGAGDAFTAALALGLTHGRGLDAINAWATAVAAYVCTQPGGTPTFPPEYRLTP